MRNFYSADDVQDLDALLSLCEEVKSKPYANKELGSNKLMVLLFFNPSLRTRISTQKAAYNLGMDVIIMNMNEGWNWEMQDGAIMKFDNSEHIKEAAKVLGSYADIIGIRTFPGLKDKKADYEDLIIKALIKYGTVPVINMESTIVHPLQSLADLFTIREGTQKKDLKVVLTWAPHPKSLPQSVPNSFLQWMTKANQEVTICHPEGYDLDTQFSDGHSICHKQDEAFRNADVIYTKNWSSVEQYGHVLKEDDSWMITKDKLNLTDNGLLMHCLPVRRNVVITDDAMDSKNSVIVQQAANRVACTQAVIYHILENNYSPKWNPSVREI